MIDHVTYLVPDLEHPQLEQFMQLLGLAEFHAYTEHEYEKGYTARWWTDGMGETNIHLVQGIPPADRGLEHLCLTCVGAERYEECASSAFCVRNSGSGRVWLEHQGLRVEIQEGAME